MGLGRPRCFYTLKSLLQLVSPVFLRRGVYLCLTDPYPCCCVCRDAFQSPRRVRTLQMMLCSIFTSSLLHQVFISVATPSPFAPSGSLPSGSLQTVPLSNPQPRFRAEDTHAPTTRTRSTPSKFFILHVTVAGITRNSQTSRRPMSKAKAKAELDWIVICVWSMIDLL